MHLIVGLGNPGDKYKKTRHNVGFVVVDMCAENLQTSQKLQFESSRKLKSEVLKLGDIVFAKPDTFMNRLGEAAKLLINFYKVDPKNLWVIHDDLDIKFGQYKIQLGVGPKIHNGLLSIYEKLGTKDFWHVRVGIDNRSPESRIDGELYVLQNFNTDEEMVLTPVIKEISLNIRERIKNIIYGS